MQRRQKLTILLSAFKIRDSFIQADRNVLLINGIGKL